MPNAVLDSLCSVFFSYTEFLEFAYLFVPNAALIRGRRLIGGGGGGSLIRGKTLVGLTYELITRTEMNDKICEGNVSQMHI